MCEIWHLLQGVARVSSNESQIVLGFLIKFKKLRPLWICTKRQFLFKPSQAWFSLEPCFKEPGTYQRCGSTIFIQVGKHGRHILFIGFWLALMHLLIQLSFTEPWLCARLCARPWGFSGKWDNVWPGGVCSFEGRQTKNNYFHQQ